MNPQVTAFQNSSYHRGSPPDPESLAAQVRERLADLPLGVGVEVVLRDEDSVNLGRVERSADGEWVTRLLAPVTTPRPANRPPVARVPRSQAIPHPKPARASTGQSDGGTDAVARLAHWQEPDCPVVVLPGGLVGVPGNRVPQKVDGAELGPVQTGRMPDGLHQWGPSPGDPRVWRVKVVDGKIESAAPVRR